MKRISALLTALLLFVLMLTPFCAYADFFDDLEYDIDDEDSYYTPVYDYSIENYDVLIDVDEDNVFHITENISVNFNDYRHGIYRNIPYKFDVMREDGSSSYAKVKVKNIKCSDKFEVSRDAGECVIQIGDSEKTIIGNKDYKISYDYAIGPDLLTGADELYYNIVGNSWNAYIENLTFKINMPKEFDASKLGFSTGYYGATGTDIVDYKIDGNTISGSLTSRLFPGEGVTVRLELDDGYFIFNAAWQNFMIALMVILPTVCLVAVLVIWAKFGKDKKVLDVVEFYPPENMSCLDVAFWSKGRVDGNDAVPLLIELANEGYVSIADNNGDYTIKKLKPYSGRDSCKTIFMSGLFIHGDETNKSRLEDEFYTYINRIVQKYNTPKKTHSVFENKSLWLRLGCWLAVTAFLAVSSIIHSVAYSMPMSDYVYIGSFAVYLAAFFMSFFVRRRTDEGHENLQKINGFKMFLETAEKDRLEALVEENPEYFYNILPYAYVLGVSNKWIKKFEGIALEPPRWYMSTTPYNRMMTMHFISHTMHDCNKAMLSQPVNTSSSGGSGFGGSGFSGGGFSGGGFGGGGGGSW